MRAENASTMIRERLARCEIDRPISASIPVSHDEIWKLGTVDSKHGHRSQDEELVFAPSIYYPTSLPMCGWSLWNVRLSNFCYDSRIDLRQLSSSGLAATRIDNVVLGDIRCSVDADSFAHMGAGFDCQDD